MFVVIYSGGMDSYTLLHQVIAHCKLFQMDPTKSVLALSFNYGQRHLKELGFARDECARLGIGHHVVDLKSVGQLLHNSSLTNPTIDTPHGHYAAENMKQTVVAGRNTIMLSIAMGVAESLPDPTDGTKHVVYYGAHSGDHHIYPDCRPQYVREFADLFESATERRVDLAAPFLRKSKGDIAVIGRDLGLDYGHTWTCYEGGAHPCGKCGACVERLQAFEFAGIEDPLEYQDRKYYKTIAK